MEVGLLAVGTVVFIQLAAYLEEWIFKQLPGFNFYWTMALVELLFFALMARLGQGLQQPSARLGSMRMYCGVGGSLALGTGLGKLAFKYLNYATGTVLKSMKLLPVIALSALWLRRKYDLSEYLAALLMVVSAALFGLGEHALEPSFHPLGMVLSFGCLLAQAVQSNLQDCLLRDQGVSVHEAMVYSNAFGALFVLGLTLVTSELPEAFQYFSGSPLAAALLLLRSVFFYLGALLYTKLMQHAGAVLAVTVTTIRKSLTVLLSFILFPKPWSNNYAWGSLALAAAIGLDVASSRGKDCSGKMHSKAYANHAFEAACRDPKDSDIDEETTSLVALKRTRS